MKNTSGFSLPEKVSHEKTLLPNNIAAYVFRHDDIGELGRLLILPHSSGQSQFTCEVVGDPDDPMTAKRRAILEPITRELMAKMEALCGTSNAASEPYTVEKKNQLVKSDIMPCNKCGQATAMLVAAPEAETTGVLEDYARKMYNKIQEVNVPTWIIGREKELVVQGEYAGKALIMKTWPNKEDARWSLSTELNSELEALMENHCS